MKKTIIVGVSGGIAVYKTCTVVSSLKKLGYNVKVVMTKNATEFVAPLTFETLSSNEVITDMFAEKAHYEVEHISLAKEADLFLIAPCTANVIGKIASGIADDMLTTTFMACTAKKVICPAMNTNMYLSESNIENLEKLKKAGIDILEPKSGSLACGDVGVGRMEEPENIVAYVDSLLTPKPDYRGKKVLITAGATIEKIDGVRFVSNFSSGKMGVALANAVINRGGEVTLIAGRMSATPPKGITVVNVSSTMDMYNAVMEKLEEHDVIIKAAAPADYRVKNPISSKIKSDNLVLEFVKNPDIAKAVGEKKGNRILVVFAAETDNLNENALKKLESKNADMLVANDVTKEGAGFNVDTNIATIFYANGVTECLPIMQKTELADIILDGILTL